MTGITPARYPPPQRGAKMAPFEVATTTLENKAGEKVAASEALKGKVVALYVRLALSRTAPSASAVLR